MEAWETADELDREDFPNDIAEASAKLRRRRWEEANRWMPTPADITRIVEAIWPGTTGRPSEKGKYRTGTRKPRPQMTYESRESLQSLESPAVSIQFAMQELKPKSLKALISAIKEDRESIPDRFDTFVWEGIRIAAEKTLAIKQDQGRKSGKWIAVVRAFVVHPDYDSRNVRRLDDLETMECNGRDAAVATCREYLRKYADHFDYGTEIEATVYPAGEYAPLE
ncbi:MAG: hypothetical protein HOK21_15155 [Rhodospirillaceae bacterium]|jgi:hypothetical protein|nr:hypothetical protein [Rhodospirillaceae bacterium]MBT5081675.1 hypothetical protein [Rhodospirillaceae bacterium]MBT5525423.1 hypothetical protein [Rhodospirillaceae bacterium]MBT5877934.1 hypothetical protein [Rhodospirillaceae bacterium]MBT6590844.1 hypothetical protein [Rhodospirillaceae bacterium]